MGKSSVVPLKNATVLEKNVNYSYPWKLKCEGSITLCSDGIVHSRFLILSTSPFAFVPHTIEKQNVIY